MSVVGGASQKNFNLSDNSFCGLCMLFEGWPGVESGGTKSRIFFSISVFFSFA